MVEPIQASTLSSIPEFCCNCAELGHVEQDCNAAAATPQSMREGWEQYYQLLVTMHPEIANQRVPKSKCCRITAPGEKPCTLACGPNQYSQIMEPRAKMTMIPFEIYAEYAQQLDPTQTIDSVRRSLRETGVKRMRWGQRDSLWEVVGPVEVNFQLDGIDFYASALVVLDKEFSHGIVLGNDQLRCWTVTQTTQELGVAQLDENSMLEGTIPHRTEHRDHS